MYMCDFSLQNYKVFTNLVVAHYDLSSKPQTALMQNLKNVGYTCTWYHWRSVGNARECAL